MLCFVTNPQTTTAQALAPLQPDAPHMLGHTAGLGFDCAGTGCNGQGAQLDTYMEGGSGTVLSRAAMRALLARFPAPADALVHPGFVMGDTFLALALHLAGVHAERQLSARFRQRDSSWVCTRSKPARGGSDGARGAIAAAEASPISLHPVRSWAAFARLQSEAERCGLGARN